MRSIGFPPQGRKLSSVRETDEGRIRPAAVSHLIRHGFAVPPSPRGEGFDTRPHWLPLEGKAFDTRPPIGFPLRGSWQPEGLTDEVADLGSAKK